MATIDDLLANADRIMTFGLQSGRITDTRLLAAIEAAAKAKAAGTLTAGSSEATALAAAVQDAIKSISPVTLADLNRGWNPFPAGGGKRPATRAQWATLLATVLLVFAAGYYTLWHKRATDLMTFVVDETVAKQETAVLDMMLPLLSRLPASGGTETPAAGQADAGNASLGSASLGQEDALTIAMLLKDAAEIEGLQRSIAFFEGRFNALYQDRIIFWGQALDARDAIWGEPDPEVIPAPEAPALAANAQPATDVQGADKAAVFADLCDMNESRPSDFIQTAAVLSDMKDLRRCLLTAIGVTPWSDSEFTTVRTKLYSFDHALNIVGSWLLPAIYGALGALIYYMRQFLDPLRPDPPFERVVVRVALGAFAGITVGWFFTPTTAAQGFQFPDVGMAMLTFAFVLGFSIEVFFGFLERLVNLSNEGVARLGKP